MCTLRLAPRPPLMTGIWVLQTLHATASKCQPRGCAWGGMKLKAGEVGWRIFQMYAAATWTLCSPASIFSQVEGILHLLKGARAVRFSRSAFPSLLCRARRVRRPWRQRGSVLCRRQSLQRALEAMDIHSPRSGLPTITPPLPLLLTTTTKRKHPFVRSSTTHPPVRPHRPTPIRPSIRPSIRPHMHPSTPSSELADAAHE